MGKWEMSESVARNGVDIQEDGGGVGRLLGELILGVRGAVLGASWGCWK